MFVTWLVSMSGTLVNAQQPSNRDRMFVTWLVSMSGTLVNARQPSNRAYNDGPTTSIGTVISVMVW